MLVNPSFLILLTLLDASVSKDIFGCRTQNGHNCQFPFFQGGKLHYDCTKDFDNNNFKCSTKNDENLNSVENDFCLANCTRRAGDTCPTTDGTFCVFPFVYAGREYHACTTADHHELWCATNITSDTKEMTDWGVCDYVTCQTYSNPHEIDCHTTEGKICQFPFIYSGKTYFSCTMDDHPEPWCAIAVDDSGVMGSGYFGNCSRTCKGYRESVSVCRSVEGYQCKFPYEYKGKVYDKCTLADHVQWWCSLKNFPNGSMNHWDVCDPNSPQSLKCIPETKEDDREYNKSLWTLIFFFLVSIVANAVLIYFLVFSKRSLKDVATTVAHKFHYRQNEERLY